MGVNMYFQIPLLVSESLWREHVETTQESETFPKGCLF